MESEKVMKGSTDSVAESETGWGILPHPLTLKGRIFPSPNNFLALLLKAAVSTPMLTHSTLLTWHPSP